MIGFRCYFSDFPFFQVLDGSHHLVFLAKIEDQTNGIKLRSIPWKWIMFFEKKLESIALIERFPTNGCDHVSARHLFKC